MGGLQSSPKFSTRKVAVLNSPVENVLPIYYTKEELTETELEAANKVWNHITSNHAATYVHLKKNDPNFEFTSCADYFYEIFYGQLLDFHPGVKSLFKKGNRRMRQYFIGCFTMMLDFANDVDKFKRSLVSLAYVHNHIGVKAIECKSLICLIIILNYLLCYDRWSGGRSDYVHITMLLW